MKGSVDEVFKGSVGSFRRCMGLIRLMIEILHYPK